MSIITLDLSAVRTAKDFHKTLKEKLGFPEFYGMNWDAFWDAITGLVELPDEIQIFGWDNVMEHLPEEAAIFQEIFVRFSIEYPMLKCKLLFE